MQNLMPPINTPDQLFHDGDPTQGIEGTIVTADYLNN
ncbi:TPA: phage tail protein, partial [Escherichia coli]